VQTPKPLFHRSVRGNKLSPRAPFSKGIRKFLTAVSYHTTSLPRSPLRLRAQLFVAASPLVRTVILFVLGHLLAFGGVYLINNLKPEEGEGAGHRALEGAKSITSPAQVACSTWQGDIELIRGRRMAGIALHYNVLYISANYSSCFSYSPPVRCREIETGNSEQARWFLIPSMPSRVTSK